MQLFSTRSRSFRAVRSEARPSPLWWLSTRPGDPLPTIPTLDQSAIPHERDLLDHVADANARAVYADWLDERGDAVRSMFLRLDADDATHELALRSFATERELASRVVVSRASANATLPTAQVAIAAGIARQFDRATKRPKVRHPTWD